MNELHFDASGTGVFNGNYFGFPWNPDDSELILVNIPWDATTSYRRGTSTGPEAMIAASTQLDFFPFDNPGTGLVRCGTDTSLHDIILNINHLAGEISTSVIASLESGKDPGDPVLASQIAQVNQYSLSVRHLVYERTKRWLDLGKQVILVGGEHSIPLGYLHALAEKEGEFGILQIDAHADLRIAYEGFEQSHASIMYNALAIPEITKIVQVGIRDVSEPEMLLATSEHRIHLLSDHSIQDRLFCGGNWFEICRDLIQLLPKKVYISFDIDGLQPQYCPNTGTPVPGGRTPDEAMYLIRMIAESGRRIIGADLCEVAPGNDDWDANTGSRILYRLAVLMRHSVQPTEA
jgi:agmatinase